MMTTADGKPAKSTPYSRYLVSGSYNEPTRAWSVETHEAVGGSLHGRHIDINSVAFSPDGESIVSSSHDETIRVRGARARAHLADCEDIEEVSPKHTLDVHRAHRDAGCARLEKADGQWVRSGDKLLLWVTVRRRKAIKKGLKLVIGGIERKRRKSEVDVARLFAYSGLRWIDIYNAFTEI